MTLKPTRFLGRLNISQTARAMICQAPNLDQKQLIKELSTPATVKVDGVKRFSDLAEHSNAIRSDFHGYTGRASLNKHQTY